MFRREFWKPDPNAYKTESKKANLNGLLIIVPLAMRAKFDGWKNATSDLIPLFQSLNEEVDAIHSLAAMVFGNAKNKVSSIGIEYA